MDLSYVRNFCTPADPALNCLFSSPFIALGSKQTKSTMTKKTKNKAAKARKRPVKKKKEETTLKSKATKELRARHLAKHLCLS